MAVNELGMEGKISSIVGELSLLSKEDTEKFVKYGSKFLNNSTREDFLKILKDYGITEKEMLRFCRNNKNKIQEMLENSGYTVSEEVVQEESSVEVTAEDLLGQIDAAMRGEILGYQGEEITDNTEKSAEEMADDLLREIDKMNGGEPQRTVNTNKARRTNTESQPAPTHDSVPAVEPEPTHTPAPAAEPVPQPESQPRSEKAQKLINKIDKLIAKVEQEKSPVKRHVLSFKIKMLQNKIQKELDLQNLKEEYELKREDIRRKREQEEITASEAIPEITANIKFLKNILYSNEEYDYGSSNFMYPEDYVQKVGGIDNLAQKLKSSSKIASQDAARKIEEMSNARQKLKEFEDDLAEQQKALKNGDRNFKIDNMKLKFEETALIVKDKVNIFSKIGNFFGTMKDEVKSYFGERKEYKELAKLQKAKEAEIKEQCARAIREHKKQAKAELEARGQEKARDAASSFRNAQFVPIAERIEEPAHQDTVTEEQTHDEQQAEGKTH